MPTWLSYLLKGALIFQAFIALITLFVIAISAFAERNDTGTKICTEKCLASLLILPLLITHWGGNENSRGTNNDRSHLRQGEQKAVALADFLTEVTINPASAAIVLDDPVKVTSAKA